MYKLISLSNVYKYLYEKNYYLIFLSVRIQFFSVLYFVTWKSPQYVVSSYTLLRNTFSHICALEISAWERTSTFFLIFYKFSLQSFYESRIFLYHSLIIFNLPQRTAPSKVSTLYAFKLRKNTAVSNCQPYSLWKFLSQSTWSNYRSKKWRRCTLFWMSTPRKWRKHGILQQRSWYKLFWKSLR